MYCPSVSLQVRVPRVSGDEPIMESSLNFFPLSSPRKRGWTVDSAIIQEDLRFFPHYVIGGVDRKNNFFFPFTAELYTYMEVNRNDGFFNGLISSTR